MTNCGTTPNKLPSPFASFPLATMEHHLKNDSSSSAPPALDSALSTPSTTSSISERLLGRDLPIPPRTFQKDRGLPIDHLQQQQNHIHHHQHPQQQQQQHQLDAQQLEFERHKDQIRLQQQVHQHQQQNLQYQQHQQRLAEQQSYQLQQLNRIHQEQIQLQQQQQQQGLRHQAAPVHRSPTTSHHSEDMAQNLLNQENVNLQNQLQNHNQIPNQHLRHHVPSHNLSQIHLQGQHQRQQPQSSNFQNQTQDQIDVQHNMNQNISQDSQDVSQEKDKLNLNDQLTIPQDSSQNALESNASSSLSPPAKRTRKARSKYFSPCDACSFRKVKCDQKRPCSKCLAHNIPCTNNRMRKRCGPKHLRRKTREVIDMMTSSSFSRQQPFKEPMGYIEQPFASGPEQHSPLTIDKLLPFLQVFQTWYYGVWPVVSVAHLVAELTKTKLTDSTTIVLSESNIPAYSLSCAIAAAIDSQVTFLTTKAELLNLPTDISGAKFADECVRSRSMIEFREHPTAETLLTSFFLYAYYVNIKLGLHISMVYLREAISMAQIMGLHDPNTYDELPAAEGHRLRKIYYMLLVTERFMCISDNLPVILDAAIPFPELEDEEYSTLLAGFSELVKVFAIPDKRFFDKMITSKSSRNDFMSSIISANSSTPGPSWIQRVQDQLSNILIMNQTPENQKLNILLSKYWMMSLAWHVSQRSGLIVGDENEENCFSVMYPIKIARDFIDETSALSIFAFESNGPGVCIKLLEIALGLMDSLTTTMSSEGFASLYKVFMLVHKLKNDITLPVKLYQKVEKVIQNQVLPTRGYISELTEDELRDTSNEGKDARQMNGAGQSSMTSQGPAPTNYPIFPFDQANQVESEQMVVRNNGDISQPPGQFFPNSPADGTQPETFDTFQPSQFHGLKLILSPFTLFQQFSEQQLMPTQESQLASVPEQLEGGQVSNPQAQEGNVRYSTDPYNEMGNPLLQVASAYSYPPRENNSNGLDQSRNSIPRDYRR